ncbi:hypothetical protein AAA294_01975 [Fusobacterium varium]|uniref:hypothetical protein n=1 Tax=Fusobacterium varium TaxID=856 RepID=UPI0032C14549
MGLRDIEYNNYTYTSGDIIEYSRLNTDISMFEQKERTKIKQATYFKISEVGKDNEFIKIDKHNINSFHADIKDKIFVFSGDINPGDETIKLSRLSKESRTNTPFFKNIEISIGDMDGDNINVKQYKFIGYIVNYYEVFDNNGNGRFEIAISHRENFYNEDILINRQGNLLSIAKFPRKKEKLVIPIPEREFLRIKNRGLQPGNVIWSAAGIVCSVIGISGAVAVLGTVSVPISATILASITVLYAANTIFSGIQSIRLDYVGDDDILEAGKEWYTNPIRWGFTRTAEISGVNGKYGEVAYYGSEIVVGGIGVIDTAKGVKVASMFKRANVSSRHPLLGPMYGSVKKFKKSSGIYYGFQFVTGGNNLSTQWKGFKKTKNEVQKEKNNE